MFNPSQHEVRRFFCEVHDKRGRSAPLTPLESIAAGWIDEHPEYHALLAQAEEAVHQRFDGADGQGNPFLHLSMHLAISEQLSIDQPPGIRGLFEQLAARFGNAHEAAHQVMECLGEVLWRAQRDGGMPDGGAYLDGLRRRAGQSG
jgi:hypothetical protein